MALIKKGSLLDFSVKPRPQILQEMKTLKDINTFRELSEISRISKPLSFDVVVSPEERGLALKALSLSENFNAFLNNYSKNTLYMVAFSWDMSDKAVYQYPEQGKDPSSCMFKISPDQIIEFPKEGLTIFPKRKVHGGCAYRVLLMESAKPIAEFNEFVTAIADTIKRSELSYLLGLLTKGMGVNGASIFLISQASKHLTNAIGDILKTYSDDYVDYIEGYYESDKWVRDFDTLEMRSSTAVINRF